MNLGSKFLASAIVLSTLAFAGSTGAFAGVTTFTGTDLGVGPGGAHPLSDAAAAAYDASTGPQTVITFESSPVASFTDLNPSPGVDITGIDRFGNDLFVSNTPNLPTGPALDGFNTTPGGSNYLELQGGNVVFSFANPISSFGAYFTGVQPEFVTDTISFNDGTSQSFDVPAGDSSDGGVSFAGFNDPGASISSITIFAGNPNGWDDIGIDDVQFTPQPVTTTTPEPSSLTVLVLAALGLGGLITTARKRQTQN
jgi:hypothetical protein